jgi:hypothetical protein
MKRGKTEALELIDSTGSSQNPTVWVAVPDTAAKVVRNIGTAAATRNVTAAPERTIFPQPN